MRRVPILLLLLACSSAAQATNVGCKFLPV